MRPQPFAHEKVTGKSGQPGGEGEAKDHLDVASRGHHRAGQGRTRNESGVSTGGGGGRDVLEGGGGLLRGVREGGLAGTPLLPGSPYGPRRRQAKIFEASILWAPKAPKQNFGCQPQTLEGEEGWGGSRGGKGGKGGGGITRLLLVYCRSNTSLGVGDNFRAGITSPWKIISEGENFATLANPKAHTASRTHCTAKAPRFRRGKISPRPLKTKLSCETIPRSQLPPEC